MSDDIFNWEWPFQMPRKPKNWMKTWLDSALEDEKEAKAAGVPWTESGEYAEMQAHKQAVDQKAQMAEFQAAQKGAPQSYTGKLGEPFGMSRYKDVSMFPAKGTAKSDPARLQASPVGYDKEEWWRQSPYRSPVQENYSIFSMKPYSW
jgi:hypothetical protein